MSERQQAGQDNSLDFLWVIGLIIGVAVATWYFGKVYITKGVLYVRLYEAFAIEFVLRHLAELSGLAVVREHWINISKIIEYIYRNLNFNFSVGELLNLSGNVGSYLRYPLGSLMLLAASMLYLGGSTRRFRHVFTTKLFRQLEKKNWPQITPIVNLDLVNQKIGEGPWAMALSPLDYCKNNELINITVKNGVHLVDLRSEDAYRTLSLQLGPRWKGVDFLPIYLRALFVIFAARINGDKKSSEALLDQISLSAATIDVAKMNFNGTNELLAKYSKSKKVMSIAARHGYVTTLFASLLVGAREAGVLATSEFIWLKPLDRRMWYMLNTVGRPTAVAEICGAFAHWLAEKRLGMPLIAPMVDEGIRGLEVALSEVIYKPDEDN